MRRVQSLALLLSLAALLTACGGGASLAVMRHPGWAGAVEPNRAVIQRTRAERNQNLPPGVLSDDASITSMDANQTCVSVVLRRAVGDEEYMTDLQYWQPWIKSGGQRLMPSASVRFVPTETPFTGDVVQARTTGVALSCVQVDPWGNCVRFESQNQETLYIAPGTIRVRAGGGTMCFANPATIGPDTRSMVLYMDSDRGTEVFKWKFDNGGRRRPLPPQGPLPSMTRQAPAQQFPVAPPTPAPAPEIPVAPAVPQATPAAPAPEAPVPAPAPAPAP